MVTKTHGTVIALFVIASLCYLSQWFGAAVAIGGIGIVIELIAWVVWIHGRIYDPRIVAAIRLAWPQRSIARVGSGLGERLACRK